MSRTNEIVEAKEKQAEKEAMERGDIPALTPAILSLMTFLELETLKQLIKDAIERRVLAIRESQRSRSVSTGPREYGSPVKGDGT